MPPKDKSERHVGFKLVGDIDTQAVARDRDYEDGPPRVFVRTPTLPTGGKGADIQVHPIDSQPAEPANDYDQENSSVWGSGSRNDDSSNPRDGDGTVSPTSSRSESPTGSPARKREEDLAGIASKRGDNFGSDDRDATLRNVTEEDEHPDVLKDPCNNHQRTLQPATAAILGIRVPELNDVRDTTPDYQPPPSEADVTDRGETAFNARKEEILTTCSPIESGDSDVELCEGLDNRLDRAMIYRPNHREGFMPRGKLEKLVNVLAVEKELMRLRSVPSGRSTRSWAEIICGEPSSIHAMSSVVSEADTANTLPLRTYRKIFAVLVQMNKVEAVFDFVREEVSDEDLPLMQYLPAEEAPGSLLQLRRKNDGSTPVDCFVGWRNYLVRTFFGDQWAMVSPFFARGEHRNVRHYQLADGDILPFTYDSRDESGPNGQGILERGGFGEVFKVRIHHDHHGFEDKGGFRNRRDRYFAVKKLYSTHAAEWKSEIEILKRFSANPNPHLISLLATYEKSGHVHLIFYWADADLQKYWKTVMSNPTPGLRTTRWVARQCLGIASGIVEIHKHLTNRSQSSTEGEEHSSEEAKKDSLYGRHGDIKPRNILWFKDGPDPDGMGTLVITDFGIAEMNSKNSRSGKPGRYIKFSPTYCAPEAHVPGGEIRQSYDIWTLGCLYLEFLTWLLGGWKLVFEFAQVRQTAEKASAGSEAKLDRFFELEFDEDGSITGAKVKSEVTDFIKRLHSHPNCTDFVHNFLKIIENDLLIIETKETRRLTSQLLHAALSAMKKKMESEESYGATPTPEGTWVRPQLRASDSDAPNTTGDMEAAASPERDPQFDKPERATM